MQSSGRDGACRVTDDCLVQRTASNPRGMVSCGQPPWLWSDDVGHRVGTPLRIQRTTVPGAVGSGGGYPSKWAGCTSCDTLRWPCADILACALRTSRLALDLGIQDADRAGAASWPWAITSRQNKNARASIHPLSGWLLALAFNALALFDIQDDLHVAGPAVDRQLLGLRFVRDPQQPVVAPAIRAGDPSVLYD